MLKLLSKEISILLLFMASIEFIMWKILFAILSIKEVNLSSIIVIFILSILPIIALLFINILLKKEIREYSEEIAAEISRVENHNKRASKFDNYKYFSEIRSTIAEKNEREKEKIKELEEGLKIREQELTRTKEEGELMLESAQAAFVLSTAF